MQGGGCMSVGAFLAFQNNEAFLPTEEELAGLKRGEQVSVKSNINPVESGLFQRVVSLFGFQVLVVGQEVYHGEGHGGRTQIRAILKREWNSVCGGPTAQMTPPV